MMTDWIVHYVMLVASVLGNFVALPVFLVAAILLHRRVRSSLSLSAGVSRIITSPKVTKAGPLTGLFRRLRLVSALKAFLPVQIRRSPPRRLGGRWAPPREGAPTASICGGRPRVNGHGGPFSPHHHCGSR